MLLRGRERADSIEKSFGLGRRTIARPPLTLDIQRGRQTAAGTRGRMGRIGARVGGKSYWASEREGGEARRPPPELLLYMRCDP